MQIAIIGAGAIGAAIARALTRAGIAVSIANSRGPASLAALATELGPRLTPVTVHAAAQADVVFLAVPWSKIAAAVEGLGPWQGRLVIDANNPIEAPAFQPFALGGRTSSEIVASLLPGARVVKAFNHLQPGLLSADPTAEGGRRVLFVAGDDEAANRTVLDLIELLGFAGLALGGLVDGGRLMQFPGGVLPARNLVHFA